MTTRILTDHLNNTGHRQWQTNASHVLFATGSPLSMRPGQPRRWTCSWMISSIDVERERKNILNLDRSFPSKKVLTSSLSPDGLKCLKTGCRPYVRTEVCIYIYKQMKVSAALLVLCRDSLHRHHCPRVSIGFNSHRQQGEKAGSEGSEGRA